ncbi:MAG: hypothetical protein Q8R44_10875 [Novosphingobium sp.]|nr:hypothetical protein [Novosphingobium sp.]
MTLVLINGEAPPQLVARVPPGEARREQVLRDLIHDSPAIMPVHELDPSYGRVFTVAREFNIPGVGYVDVLLADERGRLVVVECKLWRNPQARREVVGQILDYARELSRFGYEDLQRQIAIATRRQGNALYAMAREAGGTLDEAAFVDRVSRDLAAGRFLLLVVGDGIAEGTRRIGEYLRDQPGLAFGFGLIEIAEYRWTDESGVQRSVVQPRILAQTAVIERHVIRNEAAVTITSLAEDAAPPASGEGAGRKLDPEVQRKWRAFAQSFIEQARFDDPSQPPPRIGGLGWMRLPLPRGHWITLWRASARGEIGAYLNLVGSEGQAMFAVLREEQALIDAEIADAGLAEPTWERTDKGASVALRWPAPLPWDEAAEQRQLAELQIAANQMVNSFRPRIERIGADGLAP